jgi:hypothetical protein
MAVERGYPNLSRFDRGGHAAAIVLSLQVVLG